MPADGMQAGLWFYTALAVVAGVMFRRPGAAVVALAVAWVPVLLGQDPATARSAVILLGWWGISRWGWRWLTLLVFLGTLFGLQLYQHVTGDGWQFGKAFLDAFNSTIYVAVAVALAWFAWQLLTGRGRYVMNPLAIAAERRKRQSRAEHQKLMGYGRRGLGRLGGRTRQAITGRPRELPRPPDVLDAASERDLVVLAGRAGIDPDPWTADELRDRLRQAQRQPPEPATARPHPAGPPPATAEDAPTRQLPADEVLQPEPVLVEMHGTAGGYVPEPFAQPAPWRWRSR